MAIFLGARLEGPNLYEQWIEDGVRFTVMRSLNETAITEENKAVRSNGGPRRLGWGRMTAQLSDAQYKVLCKQNPDLCCGDGQIEKAAWRRVLRRLPGLALEG